MPTLDGKRALVTGASRGIGRAIALRLAELGADVAVQYRDRAQDAADTATAVAAYGRRAWAVQADLADADQAAGLVARAAAELGGLDVVVNNAGVSLYRALADIGEADYSRVLDTNLRGPFLVMRAAASLLPKGGRIINVTSNATRLALPGSSVYAASKAALEQLTRVASRELGPRGITVNAVAPGPVETDMWFVSTQQMGYEVEAAEKQAVSRTPLGRLGQPQDVSDVVGFLAGPEGRWITGQIIFVDGGLS